MKTRNPVLDLFRLVFAACLAIVVLAAVGWALPNTGLSRWTVPALRPALIALFASLALYSMGHPASNITRSPSGSSPSWPRPWATRCCS